MGVYIKNMEMPTDCALLLKIFPDGSVGVPVHLNWAGTMVVNDAKAVPVPPHGRLIDANALTEHDGWMNEDRERNVCQTHITFVYSNDIANAPTILEAEDGEA